MAISHVMQMTSKDIKNIIVAIFKGKVSVNSGHMDSRISWAAWDTIGLQAISIRPFRTAWFFAFKTDERECE